MSGLFIRKESSYARFWAILSENKKNQGIVSARLSSPDVPLIYSDINLVARRQMLKNAFLRQKQDQITFDLSA